MYYTDCTPVGKQTLFHRLLRVFYPLIDVPATSLHIFATFLLSVFLIVCLKRPTVRLRFRISKSRLTNRKNITLWFDVDQREESEYIKNTIFSHGGNRNEAAL